MKKIVLSLFFIAVMIPASSSYAQGNNCATGWLCGATMSEVAFLKGGFPFIQTATCCDYSSASNACHLPSQNDSSCDGERINGGFVVSVGV